MSTIQAYPQIIHELDELRGRWRQQKLLEGFLLTAAAVFVVLALTVAADNLLRLGPLGRSVLALALWGTALFGLLTWIVRRWLEDRRDDFFAALVEERHPELSNRLINGLQLGRGNHYGSPRLIEAIVADAVNATADMDLGDCLDWTMLKRAGILAGLGLAIIVGYATLFAPRFGNGFARVMIPFADIPAYTATQIIDSSVRPGDGRVAEGSDLKISAQIKGKVPAEAQLLMSTDGKSWRQLPMQAPERGGKLPVYRHELHQVNQSFDYSIVAGDGQSRQFHVDVVERPRVAKIETALQPPAYTGIAAAKLAESDGEILGVCGTTVRLQIHSTKPLKEASLTLSQSADSKENTDSPETLALTRDRDDRTWSTTILLWDKDAKKRDDLAGHLVQAPNRYRINLSDRDGYQNSDPLWHSITLAKDLAPTVAVTLPGHDLQIKPADTVELAVRAKDDFGLGSVRLQYRVNTNEKIHELAVFAHDGAPKKETVDEFKWELAKAGLKSGDIVQYWATAVDRNDLTGPGKTDSQRFSLFVITPEQIVAKMEYQMDDYAQVLEELVRLQGENRAQTAAGVGFEALVLRQTLVRGRTRALARKMETDASQIATMIAALDELHSGLMADAIRLLEGGRDAADAAKSLSLRNDSLPVQEQILEQLKALLARLQKNEQARKELKKLEKTDKATHAKVVETLSEMVKDLDRMLKDDKELSDKFEKLPKKKVDEAKDESNDESKDMDALQEKLGKWAKGKIDELTKMPTGFVDDFGLHKDLNSIFEEVEKSAQKPKPSRLDVALEDNGFSGATKMLEDLESWLMDTPDAVKVVLEEPIVPEGLKVPEMPLPEGLEDLVGDLLQDADEFDEDADDVSSAWGDNLNQAGWGVTDGPTSTFSAKGKTGNDLPNDMELTGRSGDGRRGKSSGQMVGQTSRGLDGRKTPARVTNERYEPGKLEEEGKQDPGGSTGGGKKSGSGKVGLQGGTPPDFVKDMGRLSEKQAGLREKAERVADRLEAAGVNTNRLNQSIKLMKSAEDDLRDLRYEDAAHKRRVAIGQLKGAFAEPDQATSVQLSRARDLPASMRDELLQSTDEKYPEGYESLLKSYFRALSEAEK